MKAIRALAIILIAPNLSGCAAVVPYAISAAMIGGGNEIVNGGAIAADLRRSINRKER